MPDIPTPSTLSVDNLACVRGERPVFARLQFAVEAGGAVLLSGPNGSGKTSLLRLLAGFARPAAGKILWNGDDVALDREAHAARLHYVGHQDAIKSALTVAENLRFWARLAGFAGAAGDSAAAAVGDTDGDGVAEALGRFGLARLADEPARILSAGQRRRLALARLLVSNAVIWLLDEPNAALDIASVGLLEDIIRAHRESGGIVVLSCHFSLDLIDAQALALDHFVAPAPAPAEAAAEAAA